jgi:GTP-binding protein HflX
MRRLTGADVYVKDQLFATLDTTTRKIRDGNSTNGRDTILLVDTVGFIRRLPTHLVSSFEATLKDIAQADLYLHVVDVSHRAYEEHMEITDSTLRSIENPGVETIYVFNKTDVVPDGALAGVKARYPEGLFVSARNGTGLEAVSRDIAEFYYGRNLKVEVKIDAGDGKTIAKIRSLLRDVVNTFQGDVCVLNGTIESSQMGRLESVTGAQIRYLF